MRRFIGAWNRFFFEPADPLPLALFRIFYGLIVMFSVVTIWPDVAVWFGDDGVMPRTAEYLGTLGPRVTPLVWLPAGEGAVRALFGLLFASALCLSLGLFTRISAPATFLALLSIHNRNPLILDAGDVMLRVCGFFLMFSQAGRVMSVDRLIRIARGHEGSPPPLALPWAQRMIQLQVSIVYLSLAASKLTGELWRNGTAIWYSSQLTDFERFPVPYLFDHLWTVRLVTWGILATELALATLIWIPRFRGTVLRVGLLMHIGLEYSMNVGMFHWIMMSTYVTFVAPSKLRAVSGRRSWRINAALDDAPAAS